MWDPQAAKKADDDKPKQEDPCKSFGADWSAGFEVCKVDSSFKKTQLYRLHVFAILCFLNDKVDSFWNITDFFPSY